MQKMKRKQVVFLTCCVLIIALLSGLLFWSHISNRDDKITIGRMLAFTFENQKFALLRLQTNLEEGNDAQLSQEIAQLEALKSYNFFETGVKKLPWDSIYEDLFKELGLIVANTKAGNLGAEEARTKAIALTKQIYDNIIKLDESCGDAEKGKYLNYYRLIDEIFN